MNGQAHMHDFSPSPSTPSLNNFFSISIIVMKILKRGDMVVQQAKLPVANRLVQVLVALLLIQIPINEPRYAIEDGSGTWVHITDMGGQVEFQTSDLYTKMLSLTSGLKLLTFLCLKDIFI